MKKTILALTAAAIALGGTAYAQNAPAKGDWATKTVTRAEAQAKAADMFAKMDANKDGKLDQADRAAHRAERKQAMFARLDTDKNGAISRDEFNAERQRPEGAKMDGDRGHRMGKHHGGKRGHGGMGMMMGKMADTNKDGAVSRAEFLAAHDAHFAKVDANKDGSITPDERKAAMAQMREHKGKMRGAGAPPPAN